MAALDTNNQYGDQFPILEEVAHAIEDHIMEILQASEFTHIDSVSGRAKSVESFLEKADRVNKDTGRQKYNRPLEEIQDQIGIRVVTLYISDIEPVRDIILKDFARVEDREVVPDDPSKFGYESRHLVCRIPENLRTSYSPHISYFELQICTLFQHAWAEANHDLMYKPSRSPSDYEERLLAWAASQAFGADKVFDDLLNRMQDVQPPN